MLERIRTNWSDVRTFGLGVLARHGGRMGDGVGQARLKDIGTVHVRRDQSDMECLRQVFAQRQYEVGGAAGERLRRAYDEILRSGQVPVIVDAGANIGAAALWYAAAYPEATVVAIEPDPDSFRLLHLNVSQRPQVLPVRAAIGGSPGFVEVKSDGQAWVTRTERAPAGLEVITVSEAVERVPNGRLFIVKIDIEGFEQDVFAGDLGWLDEAHAVVIEPHDWMLPKQGTSRPVLEAFSGRDFDLLLVQENLAFVR